MRLLAGIGDVGRQLSSAGVDVGQEYSVAGIGGLSQRNGRRYDEEDDKDGDYEDDAGKTEV